MLGRYQKNPRLDHWKAAKKVLRYLQGTKDLVLVYRGVENLDVVGYSDADYAGCLDQDDLKSTSRYVFMMAGGVVSWKSVKQTITISSTMEAEYMACFDATRHALWLQNFVLGLGVVETISKPLKIFCDNYAAVAFSRNTRSSSHSKHIDIKYLVVREKVADSSICIEHIPTKQMIADPLTKSLAPPLFLEHQTHLGLCESSVVFS